MHALSRFTSMMTRLMEPSFIDVFKTTRQRQIPGIGEARMAMLRLETGCTATHSLRYLVAYSQGQCGSGASLEEIAKQQRQEWDRMVDADR